LASVTSVDELREKLKRMTPSQLREVARMGRLHAKLTKQARKPHGLSATQAKVLAKIEKNGILGA
jgi:hypothetical protein